MALQHWRPGEKIRVAHCLETVGSGGVEQTRLTLARHLPADRYEQMLICTQAIGALPDQIRAAGCPIVPVGVLRYPLDPRSHWRAYQALRQFRPHIVHGAVFEGISLATLAGRLAHAPVILTEETSDPDNQPRSWRGTALYRMLTALGDKALAVSPATQHYLVHTLGLPAEKVVMVLNGVNNPPPPSPAEVAQVRASMTSWSPDQLVLGCVGRLLDSHKRFSDAIRALPRVRAAGVNARLLIVGEGPDQEMMASLAEALGLTKFVSFAGYQGDTSPYFGAMDILVHPPATEAFGLVLAEAMFARLPVVATRVGGIPDVVADGETALLVPPEQPEALADAIIRLCRHPAQRTAMGKAGLDRAKARFGAERYVGAIDTLYFRLLTSRIPST